MLCELLISRQLFQRRITLRQAGNESDEIYFINLYHYVIDCTRTNIVQLKYT